MTRKIVSNDESNVFYAFVIKIGNPVALLENKTA